MLTFWNALAICLYLVPLLVVFVARARPGREPFSAALDMCSTVCVDLLAVTMLSRFATLELATITARVLWLVGGLYVIHRRRTTILAWARSIDLLTWVTPALCAMLAVEVSLATSSFCGIWDRHWHVPLAASLRGQQAPFFNVYEPGGTLYYHYAGDVLPAMLQSLSFAHIHISAALSRAHDLLYGLIGLAVAGLLPGFGPKGLVRALACTLGSVLAGPATVLLAGAARPLLGRSITNLYTLSFRPHTSLAYLLMLAFSAALLLPLLRRGRVPVPSTRVALFVATSVLVLTDETSLALVGVLLAGVWLVAPDSLGETRLRGAVTGIGLIVVIGATVLLFGGSFAPGGTFTASGSSSSAITVSPVFRMPGWDQAPAALKTPEGKLSFLTDFWGPIAIILAGVIALLASRTREVAAVLFGYVLMTAVGLLALTKLEIYGGGLECHRFATASLFLAPFFGMYFLSVPGVSWSFERSRSLVAMLVMLGVAVPAISTVEWIVGPRVGICSNMATWVASYRDTDCRTFAGAHTGERPMMAYVDTSSWYAFAGCRPLHAPSAQTDLEGHNTFTGLPANGWEGFRKLDGWLGKAPMLAFCPARRGDPVCQRLLREGSLCKPAAGDFHRCQVSAGLRKKLLKRAK